MVKRLISCAGSEMQSFSKEEFLKSIAGSEGRVLAAETIGTLQPMLGDVTNAEFAAAMGADLLILNMFDVCHPVIRALPEVPEEETIRELKRLTGRKIGINLEPADEKQAASSADTMWKMTGGRMATAVNAEKAVAMGADFIVLTGNPGMGVSNRNIIKSLEEMKEAVGSRAVLIAGKMHGSGILTESGESIITEQDVSAFISAGADIILLPAPGTVPGITMEYIRKLTLYAHERGALVMTAVGTSQEGADTDTVKRIALMCKMAGADIHHIGDAGYGGMALPEDILAYSVAVRGVRHTYHRMAQSVIR